MKLTAVLLLLAPLWRACENLSSGSQGRENDSTSPWHVFGSVTSTEFRLLFNLGA